MKVYSIASDIVQINRASQIIQIAILGVGGGWYVFIARDGEDRYYELGAKSGLNARGLSQAESMLSELCGNAKSLSLAMRDCSKRDDLAFA